MNNGNSKSPTNLSSNGNSDQALNSALVVQGEQNGELVTQEKQAIAVQTFDQPLVLRQSPKWITGILWALVGSVSLGLIWAAVAKIEESVPAQGKLEPQGAVKEVRAPANGVLKEILVKDGERVQEGQVLLRIDSTAAQAQLESLTKLCNNYSKRINSIAPFSMAIAPPCPPLV